MPDIVKTMKLHIHVNDDEKKQLDAVPCTWGRKLWRSLGACPRV